MSVGILCVWNRKKNISTIMKFEMYFLIIPQIIELIGELITADITIYRVWYRIILDSFMIFCGIFCFIYNELNLLNEKSLHRITVGLSACVFGYVMLSHQHDNNITSKLHKFCGQFAMLMGIIRMYSNFQIFLMFFGISLVIVGITFNFSIPHTCECWQNKLYYPEMPYLIISLFIAVYVALINVIMSQVHIQLKLNENEHVNAQKIEKTCTKKVADTVEVQEAKQQQTSIRRNCRL